MRHLVKEEILNECGTITSSDDIEKNSNRRQTYDNKINKEKKEKEKGNHDDTFDVAIIGAGFAGLSAALLLGRYLRPTVIFDGGETRNSMTKHVHGYLGFENISPKQFIHKAWEDVLQYDSVKPIKEKVEKIERTNELFSLMADGGKTLAKAKFIIIATGIEDSKPNIENFERFDGNGAWHCPHCDGFQSTNKRLAIITFGKNSLSYAKEFLGWTKNIRVFIQGNHHLTDKEKTEAKALCIDLIENDDIKEIIGDERGKPKAVICKSGKFYDIDIIFYHLGYKVQNQLAKQLGCELDENEGFVKINAMQQTTIQNVYAAGDVDTDRHFVVLATASGAVAAISIYEEILKRVIKDMYKD